MRSSFLLLFLLLTAGITRALPSGASYLSDGEYNVLNGKQTFPTNMLGGFLPEDLNLIKFGMLSVLFPWYVTKPCEKMSETAKNQETTTLNPCATTTTTSGTTILNPCATTTTTSGTTTLNPSTTTDTTTLNPSTTTTTTTLNTSTTTDTTPLN